MPKVVLIDNYDSFTWNIYEYLCREGAQVEVYRNDKITVPKVVALNPDLILISPGPGNPENDSGISREVIKHFMGKIPIFGVCMGLQCMVSVLGGVVEYAGEIVHGKTSSIVHDNTGVFENVAQGISATRYHSLAANYEKLPNCLEVTARTENSGVIQGVKHKEFVLEGVQFHPESILTQEGRKMLRNFLSYRGGKWSDMTTAKAQSEAKQQSSILETIYSKRKEEVSQQEQKFGERFSDLEQAINMGLAPSLIDFKQRLLSSKAQMGLIAEIKRASPSKGPIALDIIAPEQALKYTEAGCNAISVLTEPNWFRGSILDLKLVRQAVDGVTNRPAILRKEFIFSKYQIAEARLAGADSVLLIVKMLSDFELLELYNYSMKLGMVPLVEVSNSEEIQRAVKLNPDVVGVNNRNLHSFEVDLNTTTKIAELVSQQDILLVALSGISGPEQVQTYKQQGVRGILVGESLMRAADPKKFAQDLVN